MCNNISLYILFVVKMPSKTVGANDLEKVKRAVLNIGRMRLRASNSPNPCDNDDVTPFNIVNNSSNVFGIQDNGLRRRKPAKKSTMAVVKSHIIRSRSSVLGVSNKCLTTMSEALKSEVEADEDPLSPVGSEDPSSPSVERRNARERNRVKLVNSGYDALRKSIPSARSV